MKFRTVLIAATLLLGSIMLEIKMTAQVTTAAIHGIVVDASGAVIPNAEVTVLNGSTGISSTAKSDSRGYFLVTELQTGGPYTVTITATGFTKSETTGIQLNVNDNREVNAKLAVGSEAQTVEVQAGAVQVETSETQIKMDILSNEIQEMPLLGRNATVLEKAAPGVVEAQDRLGGFAANGAQSEQSAFMLDGADVNDGSLQNLGVVVNPDAVGEVAIVTSTLNPEYSRNSGAIVNQMLKTGTNSFHGNAFEYYRDTFLNTGNYFSIAKPPIHQNVYGATIGGPAYRNKLFFFTAYQGIRSSNSFTQQTPVFSPDQLRGDFSADRNLLTGAPNSAGLSGNPIPFAIDGCAAGTKWSDCAAIKGGSMPASALNALAVRLTQQYVPAANLQVPGGNGNPTQYLYNFNGANTLDSDQGIIRVDYHLSPTNILWASHLFDSRPSSEALPFGGSTLPGFTQVNAQHVKIFNADYTHIFNPNTTNDLRGGYYRLNYAAVTPQKIISPSSAGFNITPQDPLESLPVIGVTGYFTIGFSFEGPQPRKDTNLLGQDVFTKIIGRHSLKFGATYEQFGVDNPYYANNDGIYNFLGSGTYSSGDPAIDYLLGIPSNYNQASGSIIDAISHEYYLFAQDGWKVTPDLTLNYGISWDAETPWDNHQWAGEGITCWQVSSATSKIFPGGPPGLLYPGDPGCSTYGLASVKWNHFGPRLGIAWSPGGGPAALVGSSGSHALAIRAGFGVYFNRDQEEEALQNLSSPPYFFQSRGAADTGGSPGFANPFEDVTGKAASSESNPFPFHVPPPGSKLNWPNFAEAGLSNVTGQYTTPYAYNFNLNIQRALSGNMVLQIGYVGSLGRKLSRISDGDPITSAGHSACLANPACYQPATAGHPATYNNSIHLFFPQYTAQPAIVPGSTSITPNGIPWYLTVGDQGSTGSSSYHALQASLQKQISHGLFFTLAYTYSHSLDNYSGYESTYGNGTPNGLNLLNGRPIISTPGFEQLNYGNSDYDARHRIVALYNYEVPILRAMRENPVLNEALGKWHVVGETALQSGFPVTIAESGVNASLWCDQFFYYSCGDTPDSSSFNIKLLNPRHTGHQWFDTSTFSPEPIGTYGNVGRNFFHGPGFNYTDLSLYKDFPLGSEKRYLELRLESFNVFNHTNFAQPDGNFSDGTFGQIESVIQPANFGAQSGDPQPGRATQLAAKFYF